MKLLIAALAASLATQVAVAKTQTYVQSVDHDIIKQVVIEKEDSVELSMEEFQQITNQETDPVEDLIGSIGEAIATGKINPASIVNVAKKAWIVVKDNEPVLNARTLTANALPEGLARWDALESWQAPRAETFKVSYKNLYGATVVALNYRLIYSYGGRAAGIGQYLANATIQYKKVEVLWGYVFNADVTVPQVLNMGTRTEPIAGMEMSLNWTLATRPVSLKKGQYSNSYFISGNGAPTRILD